MKFRGEKIVDKKTKLQLKTQSHKLKPVVIIGNQGLTEGVQQEIDVALTSHELIKVRINADSKQARQAMCTEICQSQQAELINQIGHIVTIYRQTPIHES